MRKIHSLLALAAVLVILTTQALPQRVEIGKPLDDGAAALTGAITDTLMAEADPQPKMERLEPLVIGLWGMKALRIVNLGLGSYEATHLKGSRIMLGLYDKEIDGVLENLIAKPKGPLDFYYPTEEEKRAVQRFVVVKQMNRWFDLDADWKNTPPPKPDPVSQWQWGLATNLGETAADVVMWFKFPNNKDFDAQFSERLTSLNKLLDEAPPAIGADVIAKGRTLAAFRSKTFYSPTEREQIAAALAALIKSTVSFASAGSGFPKRPQEVNPTPTPTPRPIATPAPIRTPTPTPRPVVPTPTPTPIATPTPIRTPQPIAPSPIATPKPSPIRLPTPTPTPLPTPIRTPSPTPAPNLAAPSVPAAEPIGIRGFKPSSMGAASSAMDEATQAAVRGEHRDAIMFYNGAIEAVGGQGEVYLYRSISHFKLNMLTHAIDDASKAIELGRALDVAYYNRGTYHLAGGNVDRAKDDLHKSIDLNSKDHRYHYNLGMAYYAAASPMAALAAFRDAIDLNKQFANAYIMRAAVWCARGRTESAIRDQEAAIKLGATVKRGCQ